MKNVGSCDKGLRWLAGSSLFVLAFFAEGWHHWFFLALAGTLIATAFAGYCPIWHGFKIDTRKREKGP